MTTARLVGILQGLEDSRYDSKHVTQMYNFPNRFKSSLLRTISLAAIQVHGVLLHNRRRQWVLSRRKSSDGILCSPY